MFERVADVRVRACAEGVVMPDETLCVDTTRTRARVATSSSKTCFVEGAVSIGETLWVTGRVVSGSWASARVAHSHTRSVHVAGRVRITW